MAAIPGLVGEGIIMGWNPNLWDEWPGSYAAVVAGVAGGEPFRFTVRSTRHGPLLSDVNDDLARVGANREAADLFLSIHANVGRNTSANGVETYFLNFATNPEAEAVAARENAGTGMAMHNLTDIVRKIALNNKLDESRDLANAVQTSLHRGIRQQNAQARNRGVKQAPFVVLIGAQMPSVLAEVSFVTNKKEAALLRTASYRQRIAQSLADAIVKYRASLKKVGTIASGAESR